MISDIFKRIRQNHALEHATVAVLLERGVQPPLGGYSTSNGFFIFGRNSTESITRATQEALNRLNEGQAELAVSPYCGTTLLTGVILSGLVSAMIMRWGRGRLKRLPTSAAAILGATLMSRPLGNSLQRQYTTLSDVSGLTIKTVTRLWSSSAKSYAVHSIGTRFTKSS